jgi:hypothetical protein
MAFIEFFGHHFQIKLSTHGANSNFRFVSVNEIDFFYQGGHN